MKTRNASLIFAGGAVLGLSFALWFGAMEKGRAAQTNAAQPLQTQAGEIPQNDWSRLRIFTYPTGGTGIFDPATGKFYMYDSDLRNCYYVRELTVLGRQMR
jgi:hypothetical protein